MPLRRLLGIGFSLALMAPAIAQQQTPQPTATGAISGVVLDAATGEPIAGAVVSLGRLVQNVRLPPRFATDSRGRFIFSALEAAEDYVLSARALGYLGGGYGDSQPSDYIFFDTVVRIRLTAGQWVPDLPIRLWRMASVTGRVLDERGEPVVGAAVQALSTARVAGHERPVGGPLASTDDRGMYTLTDLSPGRYVVGVLSVQSTVPATAEDGPAVRPVGALQTGAIGGRSSTITAPTVDVDGRHRLAVTNFGTPPPPSLDQPRAYAAQFFPGARTWASATPIDVNYGQEHAGIDFRLQPEPASTVRGRTVGTSSPGLLLRLVPAGSEGLGVGSEAATTVIEGDGSFTLLNVPAGTYTLIAQSAVTDLTTGNDVRLPDAPGFPAGVTGVGSWDGAPGISYLMRFGAGAKAWGRATVRVGGEDLNDVTLALRPTTRIAGRLALAAGTAPPRTSGRILMTTEPASGDPLQTIGGDRSAALVEGTYRFSLDVVGGVYLITAVSGYRIVSVTSAGRDVTFTGIDAATGDDVDDVVVTITNKENAIVTGAVTGGGPTRTAVLAFPADQARWIDYGWTARGFRTAHVGPGGAFVLNRLPPGEYLVAAIDEADIDRWTDRKFLDATRPSATRVTLDWGETRTLTLTRQGGDK